MEIKKFSTTFNETLTVPDITPDGSSFYISQSIDIIFDIPVQSDPTIYRLTKFPEYKNAPKLYAILLGHSTNSEIWSDPYELVVTNEITSVNLSVEAWFDTDMNEYALKCIATKNIDNYSGPYPDVIRVKVQLYIPWKDILNN